MFLAKPLFAGLLSKAGNFVLSKAKGFLDRNSETLKKGAINLLQGQDLNSTIKQTAENIFRGQKKNILSKIQKGGDKLKKIISKKQSQLRNRLLYDNDKKRRAQLRQKMQQQTSYNLSDSLDAIPSDIQNRSMPSYNPQEEQYEGIQSLYQGANEDDYERERQRYAEKQYNQDGQ